MGMGILAPKEGKPAVIAPDSPAELTTPKFRRLDGVSALKACDKCGPDVYAVVEVSRADWKSELLFCGNCARKLPFFDKCARKPGYEHTKYAVQENRQKGTVT